MPETSFPYAGGQGVTDAAYERLMSRVTGNGRIDLDVAGNSLTSPIVYADSTGRQFKVRANTAYLVRGFRWESGAEGIVKALDANTSGNPRLDLVVLRLERSTFTVRLVVIKGTPAAVPTLPALTQQAVSGSSSRYEVAIASVRVAHNTGVNAPSIASGDVSVYETWLGEPPAIGHSFARPAPKPGAIWTEYDTGRSFVGFSSKWYMYAEDGARYNFAANGSWDPDRFYCNVQRRNGTTWFNGIIFRKTGLADAVAGADIPICTLYDAVRPEANTYLNATVTGGGSCDLFIEASTGAVRLADHPGLKAGQSVRWGGVSWPSKI